jgi:hypothetical protein
MNNNELMRGVLTAIVIALTPSIVTAAQAPKILPAEDSAHFSFVWQDEPSPIALENLTCAVQVNGQWIAADKFPQRSWLPPKTDGVYELLLSGLKPLGEMRLTIERVDGRPYLVVGAAVTAADEFKLGGVKLLTATDSSVAAPVPLDDKNWTIFLEDLRAPNFGRIIRPGMVPFLEDEKTRKTHGLHDASWVTTLQNDRKDLTFAFAALQGELWPTHFEWRAAEGDGLNLTIRSGSEKGLEHILVKAGQAVYIDPVLVGFWRGTRPTQVLADVGAIMGVHVRQGKPMRRPEPGWSTWHSYGRDISEAGVLAAARFMKDELYDAGFRYIQIDGGWWLTPGSYVVNDRFPRGMRHVANQVREMDLKFGLHISPLRVNPLDPYWRDHPDWILTPYGQEKIDPHDDDMMTTLGMVYLDGSHPEVAPYLAGRFTQMVENYQPTFMKWDHHYGSLAEGERFDPTMTGLQAHNRAVRMIRAALPEDLIVTRSMGYLYGAIECYDAIRIGNDINHPGVVSDDKPYANMTYGKTSGTIDDVLIGKDYKGLIRFARSAAQNYYIHNNIAICDPDSFFTSPAYTLEEARCHITLQALMGGLLFAGDRIESLPKDRVALYKHKPIMDIWKHGKHAVPIDLFSGPDIPRIWKLDLSGRTVIGIFNWGEKETTTTWTPQNLELDPKSRYAAKDLWTGELIPTSNSHLTLTMQPHTVKLIEFH